MTITNTTRFALTQWSSGDDDFSREQLTTDHTNIGDDAALFLSGTSASPPAVGDENAKAFYWDKTNGILYHRGDTVGVDIALWTQLHPVLPGAHVHSNLQDTSVELTALSNITEIGFPVRTATGTYQIRHLNVSGVGLSISNPYGTAGSPVISINSTSNADINTVVSRDSTGQFKVGTPTVNENPATKLYVDTADALKADASSVYTKTEMASPSVRTTLNLQTLDADLTALSGLTTTGMVVRTADSTYATRSISVSGGGISVTNGTGVSGNISISLNSTDIATPSTLVIRDASGQIRVGTPTVHDNAATKSYVDTADALKANAADVYSKTEINAAKLYQYANEAGGTGTALPSTGTRTTPRIYVQSGEPSSASAITGDIWFQI